MKFPWVSRRRFNGLQRDRDYWRHKAQKFAAFYVEPSDDEFLRFLVPVSLGISAIQGLLVDDNPLSQKGKENG